jgi:hypothetical protein
MAAPVPAGTTVIVVQNPTGAVNCPEAAKILQEGLCGCCDDLETCTLTNTQSLTRTLTRTRS